MNIWMIIAILEFLALVWSLRYLYKFSIRILDLEDKANSSIDVLEEKYKKMSEVLERPVFFDSVEVRQVVNDIYECQKAIYEIAVLIGGVEEEEVESDGGKKED
tara:strand:- start:11793 stop:12104 length:312 start_codon:yes stop_codon:yes gene_type:complete